MKRILLAGATGYLGGHIATALKRQQYFVRAITRNAEKLKKAHADIDEIFESEITQPETLRGCCKDIDTVITTIGITRQKDKLTYMDVDYQGNLNLLDEARKSGVRRFIYVYIFNAEKIRHLKIVEAKKRFAEVLKQAGLEYCLINPTGFFSDMSDFLKMAKGGKVFLFGSGAFKMNPISGEDLADVCVKAIAHKEREINIGGPEILTHSGIAETAFKALGRPARIIHIPIWIKNTLVFLLRRFTSVRVYGPIEFFMTVLSMDMVAPLSGNKTLLGYFQEIRNQKP